MKVLYTRQNTGLRKPANSKIITGYVNNTRMILAGNKHYDKNRDQIQRVARFKSKFT